MKLSNEQIKPINSLVKNKLILAGPGTGKSYTILGFIIDLINNKSINPNHIIVLTFTRAATAELKKKIKNEIDASKELPQVFTLHGFSLRQLMKNSKNIKKLPENFTIADNYEERNIIQEDIKKMLKLSRIDQVDDLFKLLASNWETLNADRTDWEINFSNPEFIGAWNKHREIYGYVLRSELVYQFKNLLIQEPDANIDSPIEYLIVDEYQDLNKCDLLVISELEKRKSKLFCAGDDDQSIYGFRFAEPEGIRRFIKDIPSAKEFLINECYRCDKSILEFATQVIRQDHKRILKNLISVTGKTGEYHILRFSNQFTEADKIAKIIISLNNIKGVSYDDIIILLRSDKNCAFSNVIIKALQDNKLPISKNENFNDLFDTSCGRYLVAILKYLQNNQNDLAIRTLIQLSNGIGIKTIENINEYAFNRKERYNKIINEINLGNIPDFQSNNKLLNVISKILSYNQYLNNDSIEFSELLKIIFKDIPNIDHNFIENINKFIIEYEIGSIAKFITSIIDYLGPEEYDDIQSNGIRIMTMHKAKGLSASAVFVIGAEDENILGKGDTDEERRLLYVSLTRAKNYLFVTYCKERQGQQQFSGYNPSNTKRRNLSRFIKDIPNLKFEDGEIFALN